MPFSEKSEILVKEVELFIQYGVREGEMQNALELLRRYKGDSRALHLMRAFYASLPDPHEEAISRIVLIEKKDDIFLLGLCTASRSYFYLTTDEKALLLGEYGQDVWEPEALVSFGYIDAADFLEKSPALATCEEYEPVAASSSRFCPICSAAAGEYHLLGCPVEVCPWCDGQLSRCGCRFEQLGVEELVGEEELEELERILAEKGRIPYSSGQSPAYLSDVEE